MSIFKSLKLKLFYLNVCDCGNIREDEQIIRLNYDQEYIYRFFGIFRLNFWKLRTKVQLYRLWRDCRSLLWAVKGRRRDCSIWIKKVNIYFLRRHSLICYQFLILWKWNYSKASSDESPFLSMRIACFYSLPSSSSLANKVVRYLALQKRLSGIMSANEKGDWRSTARWLGFLVACRNWINVVDRNIFFFF